MLARFWRLATSTVYFAKRAGRPASDLGVRMFKVSGSMLHCSSFAWAYAYL
jgi:hypothetical protein